MRIDFHTHAFPPRIAKAAIASLSHAAGGLEPQTDGTLDSLKQQMDLDRIDLSVVHSIATNPRQMHKVNDFAMELDRDDRFVGFGSVHPEAPDALDELERLACAGIKGVKFHPEYQGFYADDEKLRPIYRKISELGLITLFHAGHDYGFPPPYHGMPDHLLGAKKWLDGPVVAAHWGGVGCGQEVLQKLCGTGLYFDLSFGYCTMPRSTAQAIVDAHGPDRLLFASDMPWHRPVWELRLLDTLDIAPEDQEKILWKNAAKLLKLEL